MVSFLPTNKWANGSGAFYSLMEIRWSLPAAQDLERICSWIERDNPDAAARVARIIYHGCGELKKFPNMGRASRRISGRQKLPNSTAVAGPRRTLGFQINRRLYILYSG